MEKADKWGALRFMVDHRHREYLADILEEGWLTLAQIAARGNFPTVAAARVRMIAMQQRRQVEPRKGGNEWRAIA